MPKYNVCLKENKPKYIFQIPTVCVVGLVIFLFHHWSFAYWFAGVVYTLKKPALFCDMYYNCSFPVCLLILFMVFYFCLYRNSIYLDLLIFQWLLGLESCTLKLLNNFITFYLVLLMVILFVFSSEIYLCKRTEGNFVSESLTVNIPPLLSKFEMPLSYHCQ